MKQKKGDHDRDIAEKLWAVSEEFTGVEYPEL